MNTIRLSLFTIIMILLLCSCGKQPAQHKLLLENASPESSAMTVSYFDGETTTRKLLFDHEEEKRIISEINSLQPVAVDADKISEMTVPTYGIEISDKDGFDILLTYSNGLWLLKDGTVFEASYNLKNEFDKISENISTYPSGIYMTNSAYLAEYDIRYYEKAENLTCIRNGVSLSFVSYEDNIVTVTIKNDSDTDFIYGTYFSLQKYIDGSWYSVPVKLSNYAFNDIAIILNAHDERQEKCDLTMYGELDAGVYRIEKEKLVTEFTVGMKTASDKYAASFRTAAEYTDDICVEEYLKRLPSSIEEQFALGMLVTGFFDNRSHNLQIWNSFINKINNRESAALTTVQYTDEGDPIFTYIYYNGESFYYRYDNSRDRFGTPAIWPAEQEKYLYTFVREHEGIPCLTAILSNKAELDYDDIISSILSSDSEASQKYMDERWIFDVYNSEGYSKVMLFDNTVIF